MKRLIFIAFWVCLAWFEAGATHILGGEITYKHKTAYTYDVYVTIYRDCNECKLAGGGGGFVSKDCGGFSLFVNRASQLGDCQDSTLGKYEVKRTSIQQIVPTCDNVQTICDSRSGLRFGLEAHTFVATIDFEKFEKFEDCGFNLFVKTSSRADDIDNLSGGEQNFYNYAFINPFEAHHSPSFTAKPELILPLNQAIKRVVLADYDADSVHVRMARPLRDFEKPITYNSGYNAQTPLTVWCNGDPTCKANPIPSKPVGISIDRSTGFLAFTPVKNNEKATVVYEIQAFKLVKGAMKLVSVVRRDVQLEVTSIASNNNAPELKGSSVSTGNTINVCEGEQLCFDVTAKDIPFKFPDGSYQQANTVTYRWESNIDGITGAQQTISSAPFNKLQFCWTPQSADVGREYSITVVATDDNCPVRASQSAIYRVVVHPKSKNTFDVRPLWCANYELNSGTTSLMNLMWNVRQLTSETNLYTSTRPVDSLKLNNSGAYQVSATAQTEHGCRAEFIDTIRIGLDDLYEDYAEVTGAQALCEGDSIKLYANTNNGVQMRDVIWVSGGDSVKQTEYVEQATNSKTVLAIVKGDRYGMTCVDTQHTRITVSPSPNISFIDNPAGCLSDLTYDLSTAVNNSTGQWTGVNHNNIIGDFLHVGTQQHSDVPVLYEQAYVLTDAQSGCSATDTLSLWMYPAPKFTLDTAEICGNTGVLNLKTLSKELFSFGQYDIDWILDGTKIPRKSDDSHHLIQMASLTTGVHTISGQLRDEFGCATTDSTVLIKLDNIDLSSIKSTILCQEDPRHLNDVFNLNLVGGNWSAYTPYQGVQDGVLDSTQCGTFDLNYTYDRFGCYATKDVSIQVTCKPTVTLDYPDTVCTSIDQLVLKAQPQIGRFDGPSVVNDFIQINDVGQYEFAYVVQQDQCIFTYPGLMTAVEAPQFSILPEMPERICAGESLDAVDLRIANGQVDFTIGQSTWSDIDRDTVVTYTPVLTEVEQGETFYAYQVTGDGQCPPVVQQGIITIDPTPQFEIANEGLRGCTPFDFRARLINQNAKVDWAQTQLNWDYSGLTSSQSNGAYQFTEAGSFDVSAEAVTKHGCRFVYNPDLSIDVFETPVPRFTTNPGGIISVREPKVQFLNFSTCRDSMTYHWDFGTGNTSDQTDEREPSFAFGQDTGKYAVTLTVTSVNGCSAQHVHLIEFGADIKLFIPTAFSPNQRDVRLNDGFGVKGLNVTSIDVQIINKLGQTVFESTDISEEWDGSYMGKPCSMGSYIYVIKAVSQTGEVYRYSGALNLIR